MRLLVCYQHAPTPGAPGIYRHRTLLAGLVERGWHVDLISSPINYMRGTVPDEYAERWYTHEVIDGIHHHWVRAAGDVHRNFRRRALNYLTFAATATWRGIRLARPDVVWASSPPLSVATAGRMIARRHRVPWIFEVRDLWPESAAAVGLLSETSMTYRVIDHFARGYARKADAALVPTPGLVELVREHGASHVELVTGAIGDHPPDPSLRARVRAELQISDEACVLTYVGAHGVVNGLDMLLDAAELLASERRDGRAIDIIMAGDGSDRERLQRRLGERPISGLRMLGPVSKSRVLELLAASDVGLHLLRPDPVFASALPTKVLEYLGAHLPFITTVPGLPAEVAHATGGDLATSVEELARTMRRWAARTTDETRSAGERAYAWGRDAYGLDATLDRLETLLHRVAKH